MDCIQLMRALLAQEEERTAVLNQQLGVAKFWCSALRDAVQDVVQDHGGR